MHARNIEDDEIPMISCDDPTRAFLEFIKVYFNKSIISDTAYRISVRKVDRAHLSLAVREEENYWTEPQSFRGHKIVMFCSVASTRWHRRASPPALHLLVILSSAPCLQYYKDCLANHLWSDRCVAGFLFFCYFEFFRPFLLLILFV